MDQCFIPFLWLNNIPLYKCTTSGLSTCQLVDIWVVSTFCQLWIKLLGGCFFSRGGRWHFQPPPAQACSSFVCLQVHRFPLPSLPPPPPLPLFLSLPSLPVLPVLLSPPPPASAKGSGVWKSFPGSPGQSHRVVLLSQQGSLSPAWPPTPAREQRRNLILLIRPQGTCVGTGPHVGNSFPLGLKKIFFFFF